MAGWAMSPMVRKRFVTRLFQGSLEPQAELAAARRRVVDRASETFAAVATACRP
jgi:hypothetical protein